MNVFTCVGPDQGKALLHSGKDLYNVLDIKNIATFQKLPPGGGLCSTNVFFTCINVCFSAFIC